MKRNIAFFITSNDENSKNSKLAKSHFVKLSDKFGFNVYETKYQNLNLFIIFEDELEIKVADNEISFPIGNLEKQPLNYDRFLKVRINSSSILIENDYAGTIPVYYSTRDYISLSNIEPCVVLDSKTSSKDISYENIYGFIRYMHFIWDETAYGHIHTMLPDSVYSYNLQDFSIESKYLQTVKSSKENINLSDEEVANKLNQLNDELVYRSLSHYDQIILPLSSGYDSRMILASLSKQKELKDKLYCFTYGSDGSIEVEAGRRLTSALGVRWAFIDLPLEFLTKDYLYDIHNVFGSSLHMHGMYQLEFFNEIKKRIKIEKNSCLTSGFMTGVPAGQHNSLLGITDNCSKLTEHMNKFSQSKYWTDGQLEMMEAFKNKKFINKAEERFKMAFDRFNGEIYQKAVMFDVWSRQRNFIGYYPRTLEWRIPTVSPHMTANYANFFMSLSKKHLDDRYAVELMFSNNYEELSKIVSNSNGIRSINGKFENIMFFISRVFRKFKINNLLPKKYANNDFEFSLPSVRYSGEDSLFPLLANDEFVNKIIGQVISYDDIYELYNKAHSGDVPSYEKLVGLQSLAMSLLLIKDIE